MKLIEANQLAGMNIHYRYFSFEYFLESQLRAGFQNIELWAGSPHFFLSNLEYDDCRKFSRMARERGLNIKVITPENCSVPYHFDIQSTFSGHTTEFTTIIIFQIT